MARIVVDHVHKEFQSGRESIVAVEEMSLEVTDKTFVAIVGPSGCGKTTLLNIIAGFEQPTLGSVTLDGVEVSRPGPDRGVVFQEVGLFPWLSVEENIAFGLRVKKWPSSKINNVVDELLRVIGLLAFRKKYPAELSGGMRQRVSIARVLALDPDVLLMDEPFGSLDAQTRFLMGEFLVNLWEDRKKTVVFITHDIGEALFLADQVYIMTARPGRVKEKLVVDLPRPRTFDVLSTSAFHALQSYALGLVREEAIRALG